MQIKMNGMSERKASKRGTDTRVYIFSWHFWLKNTKLKWCKTWRKESFFYIHFKIISEYDNIVCILIINVRVVGDMSLSTQGEIQFPKTIFDHPSLHVNDMKGDTGNFIDLQRIWLWKDSKINPLCFIGWYILIIKNCLINCLRVIRRLFVHRR